MLVTQIYFNGDCKEAMELYQKALGARVTTLMEDAGLVVHAEVTIHGSELILNDFGNDDGISKSGGYQLCVQFDSQEELKLAYADMEPGSRIIEAMQPTEYSPCTVRFEDRYGALWAFWV